jgi:glucose/arabinose dehydrogenase
MKKLALILLLVVLAAGAYFAYSRSPQSTMPTEQGTNATKQPKAVEIIATDLDIPWDIAFLPNGSMLVTERTGKLLLIAKDGTRTTLFENAEAHGEGGLLGVVLHPHFAQNGYLYLYMTAPGISGETENRVERFVYKNGSLTDQGTIIRGIPGAIYHDGGRMEFGPDGMLYITTGDATRSQIAQDKNSLGGKILRLHDDGSVPTDNPFGSAVWSYGHRNPQGLAWDSAGNLWESEHGRSGVLSGLDEINLIQKGGNYGWPTIEGDKTQAGMIAPAVHSGATKTWAPASLVYVDGKLYFGALMGKALYEVALDGTRIASVREYLVGEYGRIRTVRVGPDNLLYVTTSNTDGRGSPAADDDKIIRIDPKQL